MRARDDMAPEMDAWLPLDIIRVVVVVVVAFNVVAAAGLVRDNLAKVLLLRRNLIRTMAARSAAALAGCVDERWAL